MARGKNSGRGGNRGGQRGRGQGFPPANGQGRGRGGHVPIDDRDFTIYDYNDNENEGPSRGGFNNRGSGFNSPRARGRGSGYSTPRGNFTPNRRGYNTPRGGYNGYRGSFDSPRGRGKKPIYKPIEDYDIGMGRGSPNRNASESYRGRVGKNWQSRMNAGVPLSRLLNEDRPLLRPIVFVRSVLTATLFQQEEEILKPLSEDVANDEKSHVPTADQVTRVFGGKVEGDEEDPEEIEEIDFSEVGRIQAEVDAIAAQSQEVVEEKFTGFFVDTEPSKVDPSSVVTHSQGAVLGEDDDDEDDVIVYVAPHPRAGPVTPPNEKQLVNTCPVLTEPIEPSEVALNELPVAENERPPERMTVEETSLSQQLDIQDFSRPLAVHTPAANIVQNNTVSTAQELPVDHPAEAPVVSTPLEDIQIAEEAPIKAEPGASPPEVPSRPSEVPAFGDIIFTALKSITTQRKFVRKVHPAHTPRSLIKRNKPRRKALRGFGLYGASLAEAQLQEDTRKDERRIGDSDLEWGDESDNDIGELSTGIGAMDVDSDIDPAAMLSFAKSMSAEGSTQVTFDDIADTERMKQEDEEENEGSEDDEDEEEEEAEATKFEDGSGDDDIMKEEEGMLIAEAEKTVSSDDDDISTDDEESPRRTFNGKLQRIRESAKGKRKADVELKSSEDDEDFDMELEETWADADEKFIRKIKALVDADEVIAGGKDPKLFHSIHNGDFESEEYDKIISQPAKRNKDKYKDIPPELQEQWEKDRAKKAENKRKRAQDRIEAAADPLTAKKGGKKGMKDALRVARLDASIDIPKRIVDLVTLEGQIRRFLADIGGRRDMVLPPCDKETRAKIHELAGAFNLVSKSKGNGDRRYTTLVKRTNSGVNINEKKVRRILRSVSAEWSGPRDGKGGGKYSLAKHREGEEVGKAAPKIGDTNVGFKMLAAMGWVEGNRIGLSGGLDAPLTAKMKKTKLGLGAIIQ